ncbi:tumor necrosis factor receptor superfamily member 14 [Sceloporus undulatus]|uniref:tumor necrosis factor receptor superfamily member 14 n=1 Tax=Sceloporus undulatus TaxID=8520 RepID=UPI001C4BA6D3|nr:tumor necrosis factor receptor superfamily member 14 [Sceloporus undulatus]
MSQVVCIFLAMQLLLLLEALPCEDWEYEINQECCPKCGAGFRVSKNCTINSSTSCVPCSEGTYTDHPNGLTECFRCRVCDTGAHLRVNEKCTYMQNAVCGCNPGYFCNHWSETSCEICIKHAVSPPGYKVTQAGTETSNTKFVPCPYGTFSEAEMSFSCEDWTNCSKEGLIEVQAGSASSNAVCDQKPPNVVLLTTIPVAVLLFLAFGIALIILWRRRKCFRKGAAAKQKEEQNRGYIPVQDSNSPAIPLQETTQNHGEPSYCMHA